MAYQIPGVPPQGTRLIAAYDSPRRSLQERGVSLRAAPDLTGFRRYLAARQRAEEMAAAEAAMTAGLKVKRRQGLIRGKSIEAVDPQLRPVSWAVALRGDRRDIEDAWDHRGRTAHAFVLNSPSDSHAVCGYRPPVRKIADGRVADLAPASMETNERCQRCLVLLYEAALRGEVESGPWPSADSFEPQLVDERAEAQQAAPGEPAAGLVAETGAYPEPAGQADAQPAADAYAEAADDVYAEAADDVYAEAADSEPLAVGEAAVDYGASSEQLPEPETSIEADTQALPYANAQGDVHDTPDEYEQQPLSAQYEAEPPAVEADPEPLGSAETEPVVIPIMGDWEVGDERELEAASGAMQIEVDDFGDSSLSLVGEGGDALANLLEQGAEDVLVLASAGQSALIVGGLGRGADWAGTILEMDHEPVLSRVWSSDEALYLDGSDPQRVFGPFWARHAVLVPVWQGTCVVFGSTNELGISGQELFDAARIAAQRYERPSIENALADEREVAIALGRMMDAPDGSLDAALEHVLTTTAGVLGCSIAAGVARLGRQLAMRAIDLDGIAHLDPGQLLGSGPLLTGEQRVSVEESLVAGGQQLPAVVSRLRLPLNGDNVQGLLVLTHTVQRARGFTTQDHRLAEALAPAAVLVLERAGFGEGMRALEEHIRSAPATDPLTGLPNQAAWEDALSTEADRLARHGGTAAVAAFRIAGLRRLDERQGPLARDAALREAAELLRRVSRSTDLAARVGEDEFRVLVRDGGRLGARKLATRIRRAAREAQENDSALPGLTISFANARSRPQLLAAGRLVGQRLRTRARAERPRVGSARPN